MQPSILILADQVRTALAHPAGRSPGELAASLHLPEDDVAFQKALRFLQNRDEMLVDLVTRTLHLRATVAGAILAALADGAPLSQEELRGRLHVGVGVVADVVGWLTTERRLEPADGERVQIRKPTGGHQRPVAG